MALSGRHLFSINDLTVQDVRDILASARNLREVSHRPIKKVPGLRGKTVLNCFFEASTRTRTSFEVAAKRLSADVLNFSPATSALSKGESIIDTVKTLYAMQPDVLVVRHQGSGIPQRLARLVPGCTVINAGDGMHEHPTQALLDLLTMEEAKGDMRGKSVTILGDILHSRVARSNMLLLRKMGARVTVFGPRTLIPMGIEQYKVRVATSMEQALRGADVVMCLRIQRERLAGFAMPSLREFARYYGLNAQHLVHAKPDAVVLHPGPVNRGVEIAPDVADGSRSLILSQVENGIAIRMACLYLLSGERAAVE